MGDPGSKKDYIVKEIWREGDDLHVMTYENKHMIYKNIHLLDYKDSYSDNSVVRAEEIIYVGTPK